MMTAHIEMKSSESEAPLIGDMVKAGSITGGPMSRCGIREKI